MHLQHQCVGAACGLVDVGGIAFDSTVAAAQARDAQRAEIAEVSTDVAVVAVSRRIGALRPGGIQFVPGGYPRAYWQA